VEERQVSGICQIKDRDGVHLAIIENKMSPSLQLLSPGGAVRL